MKLLTQTDLDISTTHQLLEYLEKAYSNRRHYALLGWQTAIARWTDRINELRLRLERTALWFERHATVGDSAGVRTACSQKAADIRARMAELEKDLEG
jgi:hypothetical protein